MRGMFCKECGRMVFVGAGIRCWDYDLQEYMLCQRCHEKGNDWVAALEMYWAEFAAAARAEVGR